VTVDESEGLAVLVLIAVGVLVGIGLVVALLRAANRPDPALVVTSLSLITVTALFAYAFTRAELLGGIAATGMGALAGAVTGLYRRDEKQPKEDDDERAARGDDPPAG
jgi:hypothetical protein